MSTARMNCPGHSLQFSASVPITGYTWDNSKCIIYDDKLTLDWEREPNQFFFRPKLNGKITLVGELAKAVMAMDKDSYAYLYVNEKLEQVQNYDQIERFNKTLQFRFSKAACTVKNAISKYQPGTEGESWTTNYILEIKPELVDKYTDILNNINKEYDLIKLGIPKSSFSYYRRPCLQLYIQNTDYLGHFLGGNYWETEVSDASGMLNPDKQFSRVFAFRNIRVDASLPSVIGYDPSGDYYADLTDPSTNYPDVLSPRPNRYNYWLYKNGDPSTLEALHIYIWGSPQSDQTMEVYYSENLGTVSEPNWIDTMMIIEGKPAPNGYDYFQFGDPYTVVSNRTVNFVPASSSITKVQMTEKTYYARWYVPTGNSFAGHTAYVKPADDPTVGEDMIGYKYVAPALSSDIAIAIGIQNDQPSQWGQNDDGQYFHPPQDTNDYAPLLMSSWDNISFWIVRSSFSSNVEAEGREIITIKDGYKIVDVLKYLFEAARAGGISYYPRYTITVNYSSINLLHTFVTPKSNIVRGLYTLAAQKAPTTLEEFLNLLRSAFNLYWYIGDNNNIVFATRQTLTDTLPDVSLSEKGGILKPGGWTWGMSASNLQFDDNLIPERQQFKWMDKSTDVFNLPILVNQGALVKPDEVEETSFGNFTADLDYMVISGSECSLDGFALLQTDAFSIVRIGNASYLGVQYSVGNFELSIPQLTGSTDSGLNQDRPTATYKHLYDETNTIHNATLAYTAVQETRMPIPLITMDSQEHSQSILDLSSWAYYLVTTDFGVGRIRKLSVNISSRIAKLTLEHRPQ